MSTNHHTQIVTGAGANAAIFNAPLGQLDAAFGGVGIIDQTLKEWAEGEGYELTATTWDSDSVISSATVKWPDGSAGTLTQTTKNTTWLAIDAYTITHTDSSKTVTQTAVTRDSDGNITIKPALTVA